MTTIIPYNIRFDLDSYVECYTPCPLYRADYMVGSIICHECPYFLSDNYDRHRYLDEPYPLYVECKARLQPTQEKAVQ